MTEPLYLVGTRAVLISVHQHSDVEELGLNASDSGAVIAIPSEALEWGDRPFPYTRRPPELWMDEKR